MVYHAETVSSKRNPQGNAYTGAYKGNHDSTLQGFLKHRSEWNENTASIIAERDGLTLTEKHWDVIHFLRTEFYVNNGNLPLTADIERLMKREEEREWENPPSYSELTTMFPGGLITQGAKIAGCLTMQTVGDFLKVKGDVVWSIKPDDAVIDALKLMSEKNIGALMVLDNKKLVGIVSERDFTRDIVLRDRSPVDTKVKEIMSDKVVSVEPADTLEQCMTLMTERKFRHLPVLDHDQLAGVLSMPDLVGIIVEQQQFTISQLEDRTSEN